MKKLITGALALSTALVISIAVNTKHGEVNKANAEVGCGWQLIVSDPTDGIGFGYASISNYFSGTTYYVYSPGAYGLSSSQVEVQIVWLDCPPADRAAGSVRCSSCPPPFAPAGAPQTLFMFSGCNGSDYRITDTCEKGCPTVKGLIARTSNCGEPAMLWHPATEKQVAMSRIHLP